MREGYPSIPRSGHTKASLRTYRGGFNSFFGYFISTKRDCYQRDSNLGLDGKENNLYQLNQPSLVFLDNFNSTQPIRNLQVTNFEFFLHQIGSIRVLYIMSC